MLRLIVGDGKGFGAFVCRLSLLLLLLLLFALVGWRDSIGVDA